MPGLFSRRKNKDASKKKKLAANDGLDSKPQQPQWTDAFTRVTVEPEEVHELMRGCTEELKSRGLDHPFLLLPFRPTSNPSAVRNFIRTFFDTRESIPQDRLVQELRLTEPMVIAGILKWCWGRIQGGVVGWDAYELFKVGEIDSNLARDAFKTFIPLSVENGARQKIIFNFFDLLAAIAAHGKANGLSGRKLSRMAAWWAFEHKDKNNGFEGGYKSWLDAADATSHLFFAYLRSLCPEQQMTGISMLPRSLQKMLQETEYPPQKPELMMNRTNKVVMIVDTVSPTPFSLLRRANHFQYRDIDEALQEFAAYDDPIQALTDECQRVLKAISAANQSQASSSKHSTSLRDASWSRFEDLGFSNALAEDDGEDNALVVRKKTDFQGLRTTPASGGATHNGKGIDRPTTPSWADFLSAGFVDDNAARSNLLLPPDKVLPPLHSDMRQRSSQSHRPRLESDGNLEPGELASITIFDLDEAFWWVWISSLAPEETSERKSAFGRCAVVETKIRSGRWLVMEEMVAGAAPEPQEGAYIAEKKGFFSWTRRGKTLGRQKSTSKHALDRRDPNVSSYSVDRANVGPDAHARIQAKAAQLRAMEDQDKQKAAQTSQRRGRNDSEVMAERTNSVFTLQSNLVGEASSAMKWVKKYDKGVIKDAYLADYSAGRGTTLSTANNSLKSNSAANGQSYYHQVIDKKDQDTPPAVPRKELPITSLPSHSRHQVDQIAEPEHDYSEDRKLSELAKAEEAGVHPLEREESAQASTPIPPPQNEVVAEPSREKASLPEPWVSSPERSAVGNPKESKEKSGGIRKLFGRKTRAPAPSPNFATKPDVEEYEAPAPAPALAPAPAPEPEPVTQPEPAPHVMTPVEHFHEPEHSEPTVLEAETTAPVTQIDEPIATSHESHREGASSRVNSTDETEAKDEFARFDQGPLADQPAFVPDESEDGEAITPTLSRRQTRHDVPKVATPDAPEEKLNQGASQGVQDRWAQIRKNAAERAAQRQADDQVKVGQFSKPTNDGDEDTSGEETIESRVARIKARVAELTSNMETNGSTNKSANGSANGTPNGIANGHSSIRSP